MLDLIMNVVWSPGFSGEKKRGVGWFIKKSCRRSPVEEKRVQIDTHSFEKDLVYVNPSREKEK